MHCQVWYKFENSENPVCQCAPGENNIPKYMLLDDDLEVPAFPDYLLGTGESYGPTAQHT